MDEYRRRFPALVLSGQEIETTQPAVPPPPDRPQLPDFEILDELGRGGMGVVYQARQISLNRLVALKVFAAGALAAPEERARFRHEAETAARLQHPNVVPIYQVGEHHGWPYLVMELAAGGNLGDRIAGRPQPPESAAGLLETLARTVHWMHEHGVIHRDLKPANVLLARRFTEDPVGAGSPRPASAPRAG